MNKIIRSFIVSLLMLGFLFPWRLQAATSRATVHSAPAALSSGSLDPTFGTGGYVHTSSVGWGEANPIVEQPDGKVVTIGKIYSQDNNLHIARYHDDGSLDTTFGNWGEVDISDSLTGRSVAMQSDGKILIVGSYISGGSGSNYDFALMRLNPNGSLDSGFATNGKVTTDFTSKDDQGYTVIEQRDHKIVVAGNVTNSTADFGLARYNSNGSLDTGFGTNGKVTTDFGHIEQGYAITLQEDDKILVAGESYYYSGGIIGSFALARYNPNGSLDTAFGSGGIVTTSFGSGFNRIRVVTVQADHAILVGGMAPSSGGGSHFALARYLENGSLDTSFGTNGLVTSDFGGDMGEVCYAISLQTPGKIKAAGWSSVFTGGLYIYSLALAQYNLNGSMDDAFGTNGKVKADFNSASSLSGFAFLKDGRIMVAGAKDSDHVLGRYTSAGSLDFTFKPQVSFYFDTTNSAINPVSMAVQPDDRILVAGPVEISSLDFGLARLNPDGSLDTSFGTDGKVTTDFAGRQDSANALAVQPDKKIIVAGSSGGNIALARYTSTGSLDSGFGAGGLILLSLAGTGNAVAVQPDDKIVVAGTSGTDFVVVRLYSNGDPDTSFGGTGYVLTDFGGSDYGNALALQPDGKIVVAGYTSQASQKDVAIVRYNPNGTVDQGGVADFGGNQEGEVVYSVGLQPDGKILVGGYAYYYVSPGYHLLFLARFTTGFVVDSSFGTDGQVMTQAGLNSGYNVDIVPMSIRPDGKIALASRYALVQYNRDGSLDVGFSEDGKVVSNFLTALAYQSDGKIVSGAMSFNGSYEEFRLARYESTYTPPVITGFAPESGFVGTSVIITGMNFTGATSVAFNGIEAGFNVVSDTSISATVPILATRGRLRVTTPNGIGVSSSSFTVLGIVYVPQISR